MCDTLVALACATSDGSIFFAKNSDREPNEAQSIVRYPAMDHPSGSLLQCTYRSIPQVDHTHAVMLSKPFWIWGAEMGANDQGVVIGNEAVFTKIPQEKKPGLIGMDLLRLGLERADNAYAALLVITQLLEKYGQAGNCGYQHKMVYHNSFLICDREEAWVLETAGRQWAAERVKSVRSISNRLTIGKTWDLSSDDLVNYARDKKWCSSRSDFDFAACYSDFIYSTFSDARSRQHCTMDMLRQDTKQIGLSKMMSYLRTHTRQMKGEWRPEKGITGASVCMHAGWGPIRISQTTGSLVAQLQSGQPDTFWVTRSAAPCTSVFSPVWLDTSWDAGIEDEPIAVYQSGYDFWEHEILHRSILLDYDKRMEIIRQERDELENEFRTRTKTLLSQSADKREQASMEMLSQVRSHRLQWIERIQQDPLHAQKRSLFHTSWRKMNQACKINQYIK